jgi:hypothetical protein
MALVKSLVAGFVGYTLPNGDLREAHLEVGEERDPTDDVVQARPELFTSPVEPRPAVGTIPGTPEPKPSGRRK